MYPDADALAPSYSTRDNGRASARVTSVAPQHVIYSIIQLSNGKSRRLPDTAGFSLMELAVTGAIIAVLATALLNRVLFYQREAERLAVDQVVTVLRSALQLQLTSLTISGPRGDLVSLTEQNPMDWLEQRPVNYLGPIYAPQVRDVVPGSWYFDKKDKKLVYLFRSGDNFYSRERNQLNFKVKLVNNRVNSAKQIASQVGARSMHTFNSAILDQMVP
jgi:general secretion pathway protein G